MLRTGDTEMNMLTSLCHPLGETDICKLMGNPGDGPSQQHAKCTLSSEGMVSGWRRWHQKYAGEVTFELWFEDRGITSLTEKTAGGQVPGGRAKREHRECVVSRGVAFQRGWAEHSGDELKGRLGTSSEDP